MEGQSGGRLGGKRLGRLIMGLAGILLSVGYGTIAVKTLPMGEMATPGAGIFPIAVAVVMAITSLMIVLEQVWVKTDQAQERVDLPRGVDIWRLLGTVVTVVAYIVLAKYLGSLAANTVLCLVLVRLLAPALSWRRVIVWALGLSLSTYLLFNIILRVPLPEGIFY